MSSSPVVSGVDFAIIMSDVEEDNKAIPESYELLQSYPNPFNHTTNIRFRITESGLVTLKIYDVLGREVVTLIDEEKPKGKYGVEFNGYNLPSGVYVYHLKVGKFSQAKKLLLMK